MAKKRELGILDDGEGVSKLFALLPFAEIKRFSVWQANGEVVDWGLNEGSSRDALTGFGLSPSFVVFRENTGRAGPTGSLRKVRLGGRAQCRARL